MPESSTSVRRLQAIDRQFKALELRKAGASYPAIARQLGYKSPSGAYQAIMSAIKRTLREPADDVRKLELARLDDMLLAIWAQVKNGNFGAIDRAIKVAGRRAELLGLDAPVKIAPTNIKGDREYNDISDREYADRFLAVLKSLSKDEVSALLGGEQGIPASVQE